MCSCMVNKAVTVPCLLFCHEKHTLKSAQNCLHFLAEKKNIGSFVTGQVFKNGVSMNLWSQKKIGPNNHSCTNFNFMDQWTFCNPLSAAVRVYMSTELKPVFITKGNGCAVMHIKKAQIHKITKFMIHVIEFLNHCCLKWVQ